jgi:DNA polymerase III sliding clamp (beta) subunit (PCNA family)
MRYPKSWRIEGCISRDVTREKLMHAWLDVGKQRLVATDGHVLATLPVTLDEGDVSGVVPGEALKAAYKACQVNRHSEVLVQAKIDHLQMGNVAVSRPKLEDDHILAGDGVENVFPKFSAGDENTVTIALNVDLLVACARAIGEKHVRLTIRVPWSPFDPFLVEPNVTSDSKMGPRAVLMPVDVVMPIS